MAWMGIWWLIGLAVLVLLVWVVARAAGTAVPPSSAESPEQILKQRYARGELDREEYQRRLDDLRR